MTTPKRNLLSRLATAGLLLIPLAAFYFVVSRHPPAASRPPLTVSGTLHGLPSMRTTPSGDGGPVVKTDGDSATSGSSVPNTMTGSGFPASATHEAATVDPRVAAGAPMQAGFTLLAVTHILTGGSVALPVVLAPPPPAPGSFPQQTILPMSACDGTGLWIKVNGGLGFQTLTVPEDGRRHVYPFGHYQFAITTLLHSSGSTSQWIGPGGMPLFTEQPPYQLEYSGLPSPADRPDTLTVKLIPTSLSRRFPITVQPLSADGKVIGRPVSLLCRSVNATTLFAQVPAAFGPKTQQFRITIASAGHQGQSASWRIANLPRAEQNGPDAPAFIPSVRVGPYTLHAVAAEAEDTTGITDSANFRPMSSTGNVTSHSQNMDGHLWTGVPTIRYLLTARADAPDPPGQIWRFQINRVTPQWSVPGTPISTGGNLYPLELLTGSTGRFGPSAHGWNLRKDWMLQDGAAGIAYPGQQRWLQIEGTAMRWSTRTETLTLHDAEVVHDPGFGGDRVVWHHPETVTTPSGITVTVLNGHPGRRETTPPTFGSQTWWYDRGNAELLLAWRLPRGVLSGEHAADSTPRMAELPRGLDSPHAPLFAMWDADHQDPYTRAVAAPGSIDARPLAAAGYSFLRLSLWAPQTPKRTLAPPPMQMMFVRPVSASKPGKPAPFPRPVLSQRPPKPEVLPPYSWRDGPYIVTAAPLPRHLKTITLQITLREQQEKRPVQLIVPVLPSLPLGAGPNMPRPVPVYVFRHATLLPPSRRASSALVRPPAMPVQSTGP